MDAVHQFGASILGKSPLKELLFENMNLSTQLAMFFNDNKKVSNNKMIKSLSIIPYPITNWSYSQ